jgi:uncharacterized protein (TIGR03083 family)
MGRLKDRHDRAEPIARRTRRELLAMPLADLSPIDTRALFRPVSGELITLLQALKPVDWERPTVAGAWVVRDVVAHLVDVTFRRLSFHRDRMKPPSPSRPVSSDRDFVDFINGLNAQWITAAKRFSPRVLTDLFERASADIADWFEGLSLDAPALFGVSWAGEQASESWFDIGREFTELWHHQEQIRMAVGVPSLADSRYLRAVLGISVRGLPHAFRDTDAEPGQTVVLDVSGSAGGQWTLTREAHRWKISAGVPPVVTTRIRLRDDVAWKLLFNALTEAEAAEAIRVEGQVELGRPLLRARSVLV